MASTALVAGALLAAIVAGPASAATYTHNIGCGPNRVSALVNALRAANEKSASDRTVINLTAGCTYRLTAANNNPAAGPNGLPVVARQVVIHGRGAVIRRSSTAPRFRILLVKPTGKLILTDLTVSGGLAARGGAGGNRIDADGVDGNAGKHGGGLYNRGTLILDRVAVTGNRAGSGGRGGSATGTVGTDGASNASGAGENGEDTVDLEAGTGGAGGDGGGIYNEGKLVISDSVISGNGAGAGGAGGAAATGAGGDGGDGTTAGGNGGDAGAPTAGHGGPGGDGGGVFTIGTLLVTRSVISDNAAGDGGTGGSATGGAGGDGGDPDGSGGGGGHATAGDAFGGNGGSIAVFGGSATVDASTVENNSGGDAVGGSAFGGAGGTGGCDGSGGTGGNAQGGSATGGSGDIHQGGGSLTVTDTVENNNGGNAAGGNATGGAGGAGGPPC